MSSLKNWFWTSAGFLFLAVSLSLSSAHAETQIPKDPEEIAILLQKEGDRYAVNLEERKDLEDVLSFANAKLVELNVPCSARQLSEVHIAQESEDTLAGYEVYSECEDAPALAIGLYFDLDHQFLAALPFGS